MTAQLCPKPGLARRGEGFAEEVERCRKNHPRADLNRLAVDKALFLGTSGLLTPQERCLMAALLAHLDIAETAAGHTAVWPGAKRLSSLLGIGESTLRRLKASLEDKGFILRRYDNRNRPLKEGAFDLAPFLLRVPELLETVGHTDATVRSRRSYQMAERSDCLDLSAQEPDHERPTRNPPIQISDGVSPESRKDSKRDDSGLDTARTIFALPAEAEPPVIWAHLEGVATDAFGPGHAKRLLVWAKKRHGWRMATALAVATRHPDIRDPRAWFGWYATTAEDVDIEAMAKGLSSPDPDPKLPDWGEDDMGALGRAFARLAGDGAAKSYLAGVGLTSSRDGIDILCRSRLARTRLLDRYRDPLAKAVLEVFGPCRWQVLDGLTDLSPALHERDG